MYLLWTLTPVRLLVLGICVTYIACQSFVHLLFTKTASLLKTYNDSLMYSVNNRLRLFLCMVPMIAQLTCLLVPHFLMTGSILCFFRRQRSCLSILRSAWTEDSFENLPPLQEQVCSVLKCPQEESITCKNLWLSFWSLVYSVWFRHISQSQRERERMKLKTITFNYSLNKSAACRTLKYSVT